MRSIADTYTCISFRFVSSLVFSRSRCQLSTFLLVFRFCFCPFVVVVIVNVVNLTSKSKIALFRQQIFVRLVYYY